MSSGQSCLAPHLVHHPRKADGSDSRNIKSRTSPRPFGVQSRLGFTIRHIPAPAVRRSVSLRPATTLRPLGANFPKISCASWPSSTRTCCGDPISNARCPNRGRTRRKLTRLIRFARFQVPPLPAGRQLFHSQLAILARIARSLPHSPFRSPPSVPTSDFRIPTGPTPTARRTSSSPASIPTPCRPAAGSWRKSRNCGPDGTSRSTRPVRRSRRAAATRLRLRDPVARPLVGRSAA